MHHNTKDLTGQSVCGCLVLSYAGPTDPSSGQTGALWLLQCHCGKSFHARTGPISTRKWLGKRLSCGCLGNGAATVRHGQGREGQQTKEYRAWKGITVRARNPNTKVWDSYGGRGIGIAERWHDFTNFFEDMGAAPSPTHSIDRIDNNKGYEPGNCRWATIDEQAKNKRNSINIIHEGKLMSLKELSEHTKVNYSTLYVRWNKAGRPKEWNP